MLPKNMTVEEWKELRRNWRINWLSSINQLADIELQRTMWLDKTNTNPHWSYVEFRCEYVDDLSIQTDWGGYRGRIEDGLVTDEEVAAITEFDGMFREYKPPRGDAYDHLAILSDEAWQELVDAASRVRTRLAKLLTDPNELHYLLGSTARH
jgi:hypothetical protein